MFNFLVGNDNGNSEHDIFIDDTLIQQPNVNCKVDKLPWNDQTSLENYINNIFNQLIVTINSPSARPSIYYIGNFALSSGELVDNLQVGIDNKSDSEIPVVNTLANIAAYAVKKKYMETQNLSEKIEVVVDMATALPINQYTNDSAAKFQKKFMDYKHDVTVHLGSVRADVEIKFDYVKVVPEGTPVIFALQQMDSTFFSEFNEMYNLNVDGKHFCDKKILHTDIGDGTTEYPITDGSIFLRQFIHGSYNGIGHAIDVAMPEFNNLIHLPESPRQYFSDVLKNPTHKFYNKAISTIRTPLSNQATQIKNNIIRQLNKARNEIDIIAVYGGGSILLRPFLLDMLCELCKERDIKLLYVSPQDAVTLNASGLDIFVKGNIFKSLKKADKNPN